MKLSRKPIREIYDDNAMFEVPKDRVTPFLSRPLIDLNLFVGFLKSEKPDCIDDYIQVLVKRLRSLTLDTDSTADFEYESQHLSKYNELEKIAKQATLGMLKYSKYENKLKEETCKIHGFDYLRSYIPVNHCMISALVDIFEREEGLSLFKEYVDYRTDFFNEMLIPKFESLEQLYEGFSKERSGPHGSVNAFLEGGMVVSRVNRCMWHELQKEYGDPEIAYVNSCHFDFYAATLWNENFVLTRTKTLMQGDDCCDFCWHDKRYDKEMKHPPAKFWDSLK
ncbi:MAG: L-2-amino-thiazoline-4-carboxylic acid hydrolase [Candidatus Thorarchaeota archaeon]|jgi:hypothetical protein